MKTHRLIGFALGFLSSSLCLTAQRMAQGPQQSPFSGQNSSRAESLSISGTVQDTTNHPLKDIRVELTDASGIVVKAAYTNSSGSFEFSRVPPGSYHVVATSGLQQVSARVDGSAWSSIVSLRMPANNKADDGVKGNAISVAQYRIPAKARDEYRKAHDGLEKGKMDEAGKHLARALELYPDYADALTLRGVLELNHSDSQAAIADLDKAVKADANYAMAYMVMGSALNMESRFDEAIRSLQRGESLAPTYWQAHFEMGKAYIGKADYPAALRQLERAENLAPTEYPLIYLLRAHALLAMKQYPEAMTALQSYLQKEPQGVNNQQAHKMLEEAQAFLAKR
jgi:predicted Zn-dependent protease